MVYLFAYSEVRSIRPNLFEQLLITVMAAATINQFRNLCFERPMVCQVVDTQAKVVTENLKVGPIV
jgi:hypothetical protein